MTYCRGYLNGRYKEQGSKEKSISSLRWSSLLKKLFHSHPYVIISYIHVHFFFMYGFTTNSEMTCSQQVRALHRYPRVMGWNPVQAKLVVVDLIEEYQSTQIYGQMPNSCQRRSICTRPDRTCLEGYENVLERNKGLYVLLDGNICSKFRNRTNILFTT